MDIEQLKLILNAIQETTDSALPLAYFYLGSYILDRVIIGVIITIIVITISKLFYRINDAYTALLRMRRTMGIGRGDYVDSAEISLMMLQIERWKIKDNQENRS